jgi:hypothetical protein
VVESPPVAVKTGQRKAYTHWLSASFRASRKITTLTIGTEADFQSRKQIAGEEVDEPAIATRIEVRNIVLNRWLSRKTRPTSRSLLVILFFFFATYFSETSLAHRHRTPTPTRLLPNTANYFWAPGQSFRGGIPSRPVSSTVTSIASLQGALNNAPAGTAVALAAGTYTTGSTISVPANVSLRGAGANSTTITYTGTGAAIWAGVGEAWHPRVNVTAGSTQGSESITVENASGINVGDLIVISQLNPSYVAPSGDDGLLSWAGAPAADGSGNDPTRDMEQVDKVIAISGNTLTLERSLYISYINQPVINSMTPTVQPAVENLTIRGSANAPNQSIFIYFDGVDGGFVINCHTISISGASCYCHICVTDSYACEFRKNYLQGSGINPSGSNYGIYFVNNTSECLAEDNIGNTLRHSWVHAAGDSGNVFSYNYSFGNIESDSGAGWLAEDDAHHGAESFMNLHEGNVVGQANCDSTHGGDAFNVFFRENPIVFSSSTPNATGNIVGICLNRYSYHDNVVGCVVGDPGVSITNRYTALIDSGSGDFIEESYDLIGASAIGGTVFLPASLFYIGRPFWWPTTIPWPIIGPDLTPMNGMIPAEVRYHSGNY